MQIDEFFIQLAKFESLFTFQIRMVFFRKSFNILAMLITLGDAFENV
jgi:hypothetical protein